MTILEPVSVTPSGRPVLAAGEYEVFMLDKVDLEFDGSGGLPGQFDQVYKGGYVVLTSLRLIWMQQQQESGQPGPRHACMPAASVAKWAKKSQLGLTGNKLRLIIHCWVGPDNRPVPMWARPVRQTCIMLRCKGPSPDPLTTHLDEAIRNSNKPPAALPPDPTRPPPTDCPSRPYSTVQPVQGAAALPWPAGGTPPPPAQPYSQAGPRPLLQSVPQPPVGLPPGQPPAVNPGMLQQMMDMGFPKWRAARSLLAINNTDVQAAIDHLLAFGDTPGADEPFDLITGLAPPGGSMGGGGQGVGPLTAGLQAMHLRQSGALQGVSIAGPYPPPLPPPAQQPVNNAGSTVTSWAGSTSHVYDYGSEWGSGGGSSQGGASQGGGSVRASYSNPLLRPGEDGQVGPSGLSHVSSAGGGPGGGGGGGGGASVVGVSGIVRREVTKTAEAGRALDTAFQDLHALMAMAAEMVALAERFKGASAVLGGGGSTGEELDADTLSQLLALGIASPVTRETAGSRYQVELARQLTDWLLAGPMTKAGGLMPLTDVYCLFNRARGSELVSPDDLLSAVRMLGQLTTSLTLRTFTSGMLAIQSDEFSDDRVCARITALLTTPAQPVTSAATAGLGPAITPSDVSRALGCSISLAAEHLGTAEARGVVCRDEGPEGLRFFRNFFKDPGLQVQPTALGAVCV